MADEQTGQMPTDGNAGGMAEAATGGDAGVQAEQEAGKVAGQPAAESGDEKKAEEPKPEGKPGTPEDKPNPDKTLLADDEAKPEGGEEGDGKEAGFELPEGMELDQATLDEAMPILKELGLDHDQQQKLVSFYSEQVQKIETKQLEHLAQQRQEWRAEIQKDPKHAETLADAKRALNQFGDEGFKAMVQGSWMGDNPAVIGFLAKIGQGLKDDSFVEGKGDGSGNAEMSTQDFYAKEVFGGK